MNNMRIEMIRLERFDKNDIPEILEWLKDTDAEFLIQLAGPRYKYPLNEEQLLDTLKDETFLLFRAIEQETDEVIGHCQLMRINLDNKTASIGRVLLKPEKRGFGYGNTMLQQLINYAIDELQLEKLTLKVFNFNKSAYQCYLRLGFVESSREDVFFEKINKIWNCITMERNG